MITKKVTFIAKDESINELKELLKTMVEASKAEEGSLLYDIFQFKNNPKEFLVVESWRDDAALKGHQNSAHYKHYKENFEPYCASKSSEELEIL